MCIFKSVYVNAFVSVCVRMSIFSSLYTCTQAQTVNTYNTAYARRCVAYNHDGTQIAAGLASGKVLILDPKRLEEVCARHTREQTITDMKFSPDGERRKHDMCMYIYVCIMYV